MDPEKEKQAILKLARGQYKKNDELVNRGQWSSKKDNQMNEH